MPASAPLCCLSLLRPPPGEEENCEHHDDQGSHQAAEEDPVGVGRTSCRGGGRGRRARRQSREDQGGQGGTGRRLGRAARALREHRPQTSLGMRRWPCRRVVDIGIRPSPHRGYAKALKPLEPLWVNGTDGSCAAGSESTTGASYACLPETFTPSRGASGLPALGLRYLEVDFYKSKYM